MERTLCANLQIATSFRLLFQTMGFSPRRHQLLLCAGLHPINGSICSIISSPRKFAECLYYDVSPPLILHVMSRLIESTCHIQCMQSYKLHSYIDTFTYSYIHAYITYTQHHSDMVALVTHGFIWSHPFSSVLTHHCVKQHVLQTNIL